MVYKENILDEEKGYFVDTSKYDPMELFNQHFLWTTRNGINIIVHRETGRVVKRAKSVTAVEKWITQAVVMLKTNNV